MATILVVDDHATNRELLKTILGYQGHRVLEAGDARDALKVAQATRPDLIISDILMPTMDGFEFVRQLRDDLTIGTTPVVLSSAHYLSRETANLAEACGVVHILPKPSEPETILQIVELALASRLMKKPAISNEFTREHVRVVSDKLAEKVEELRAANQRLTDLNELVRQIGSEPSSHRLLEAFCRGIRGVVGARFAALGVIDETGHTQIPLIFSGMPNLPASNTEEIAGPDSLIGKCLATRLSCRAADLGGDPRGVGLPATHPRVRFAICAPIASPSRTYGWICLSEKVGVGRFSGEDEELLGNLAAQVGRAYENNVLLKQLQQRAAELEREVADRKEAERALRESEIRTRALLDASQDEILLVSISGEVLAINKAAERRLAKRMGGSNPVGAHLDRLLPQDQVEQRMALVRQVAATTTLAHWEVQIRTRWFEFWFYPVLEPDRPVSEVAVYAREITEQKKSQADLSKLFQAIQQSPMSVVITDRDGKIEYANPEFTKVTGYTLAEAVGQNPRILQSGHAPPAQYAELWNTITGGNVWRGEFLNKKKNGELFWELASIAPVKDGKTITNFVAVKEDITERKQMEEQLRQAQKMEAVGQLTGGIAHDFNNLLAIIIGNLQLLGERVSGDAKTGEYLEDALWSARRGGELTHRLLAFARKQPLKPTVFDLNDVVQGMTELLRRTLGASIRIEESLAPNLSKAFADRGELERALVNLAVNSRDAMGSAGTLTLETRNAVLDEDYAEQHEEVTPGEYVLLAVADTGTGMPPEIMQRVFEPFFTTKEVGQGSGLGLSMVYGFMKQSGGHISIYSRVGQGTSVKLYLQRAPSLPARPEEGPSDVLPEEFGEKVVLVVEDEAKLRKLAVKMLDQLGLPSIQAETAKDALTILAETHVDVLFTDIELPGGMNGTELADAALKLNPNIKILFTTGYAREAVLHDRWLQEKVPWLLKPYSHTELARELKALLAPTVH